MHMSWLGLAWFGLTRWDSVCPPGATGISISITTGLYLKVCPEPAWRRWGLKSGGLFTIAPEANDLSWWILRLLPQLFAWQLQLIDWKRRPDDELDLEEVAWRQLDMLWPDSMVHQRSTVCLNAAIHSTWYEKCFFSVKIELWKKK